MAYSAMPPSAFLVMATTRLPDQASAPSPTASTMPHTSIPSVNGGGVGTETRLPRQRSMSLKFSEAAPTLTRTSPEPGSGRSTERTSRTSPGWPCRLTCNALICATASPLLSRSPTTRRAPSQRRTTPGAQVCALGGKVAGWTHGDARRAPTEVGRGDQSGWECRAVGAFSLVAPLKAERSRRARPAGAPCRPVYGVRTAPGTCPPRSR